MFADTQPSAQKVQIDTVKGLLIELSDVTKRFEMGSRTSTVLKRINLQVKRGEFVALLGKSGSGKSTLLNMVAGLDRPSEGTVRVDGTAVERLSEGKLASWRAHAVGVVFQFFQLLPTLTALENVILPMELCHLGTPQTRHARALNLLKEVELIDQAHQLPSALSGGQQQRVAIARALANDPPLLLADEPTGNLDSESSAVVLQLFLQLVQQDKTILMVTHDSSIARYASRAVVLADGEVIDEQQ